MEEASPGEMPGKRDGKGNAGETMVEVLVSALIFLLFMAVLQSAVSFSSRAQQKSEEIRADAATVSVKLQTAEPTGGTSATLDFFATDGTNFSDSWVFKVDVEKQTIDVTYEGADGTGKTALFYVYGTAGTE